MQLNKNNNQENIQYLNKISRFNLGVLVKTLASSDLSQFSHKDFLNRWCFKQFALLLRILRPQNAS